MMYPLVRELADDGIPVTVTCRVLKLAQCHAADAGAEQLKPAREMESSPDRSRVRGVIGA